ncbi:hypothetical protein TNCV_3265421 [Trichonephila clavipes]|nr:hypothetical protein TNCV_3265421 [Trichonephila clavipes]
MIRYPPHGTIYGFRVTFERSHGTIRLKDSLDSKPPVVSKPPIVSNPPILSKSPIISKSPDPPDKKTHDKKVDSLFIVLRDSGQGKGRNYETKKERIRKEGHEILVV